MIQRNCGTKPGHQTNTCSNALFECKSGKYFILKRRIKIIVYVNLHRIFSLLFLIKTL